MRIPVYFALCGPGGKFGENQPEFEVWELLLYNCPANRANTPRIPTISQLQANLFELGLFRNG